MCYSLDRFPANKEKLTKKSIQKAFWTHIKLKEKALKVPCNHSISKTKVEEFINLLHGSMKVSEYFLKFVQLSRYSTSLVSYCTDEMSWFLIGINRDLDEECRSAMPHDNVDLSRTMVHFKQVEDIRKKRGVPDDGRPKPQDHADPSNRGNRNNFGVREQPRFKKRQSSLGNSNSQRSTTPIGDRPKPRKGNGGEMQRPRVDCAKCGCAHKGECR